MALLVSGLLPCFRVVLVRNPHSVFASSKIFGGEYRPVNIKSHMRRTMGNRSGSEMRVFWPVILSVWFRYPAGAMPEYQPFSILVFKPRFTFLLKSSTYF